MITDSLPGAHDKQRPSFAVNKSNVPRRPTRARVFELAGARVTANIGNYVHITRAKRLHALIQSRRINLAATTGSAV